MSGIGKVFPVYVILHGEKGVPGFWNSCRRMDSFDHWCSVEASDCSTTPNEGHESTAGIYRAMELMQGNWTAVKEDSHRDYKKPRSVSIMIPQQGFGGKKKLRDTRDHPPILLRFRQMRSKRSLLLHLAIKWTVKSQVKNLPLYLLFSQSWSFFLLAESTEKTPIIDCHELPHYQFPYSMYHHFAQCWEF
jgi:hypothetical protein